MRRELRPHAFSEATNRSIEAGIGGLWSASLVLVSFALTYGLGHHANGAPAQVSLFPGVDLLGLGELLERIISLLSRGGAIFALIVSVGFIGTWAACHLRSPRASASATPRVLPFVALFCSAVPVALTVLAVATRFFPGALPLTLKIFGISVIAGAVGWMVSVAAVFVGGDRQDLRRARRAVLLSGAPWYALTLYLASLMGASL
jgi:hypothetical protein